MTELRMPVAPFQGELIRQLLEERLPSFATRYLAAGLAGDPDAALSLCVAAPNESRGWIARGAYYIGTPNPGYREIIRNVWDHDHQYFWHATSCNRRLLNKMFVAARFEHPFSGKMTVYRGTTGVGPAKAATGLSWTASREIAHWFAHKYGMRGTGKPLVVETTIQASEIIFWSDDRDEQEIIFSKSRPSTATGEPMPKSNTE